MTPLVFPDTARGIASECANLVPPELWHSAWSRRYANEWQLSCLTPDDLEPIVCLWSPGSKSRLCYLGPMFDSLEVLRQPPPRTVAGPAPRAPINYDSILKDIL